ncbi:MAG TPA: FlgD immunoglobulin-like domain containing protein, partial [bacterium]|nr:FlgD immunoglobulin-like domain containing protein [bacterium]
LQVDPDDWILDEQQLAPTSADFTAEAQARQSLALEAPRPNPASLRAEIRYYLPQSGEVAVEVFDLSGRKVRELFRGTTQAGSRSVFWDRRNDAGTKVAGGVYWVRLTALGEQRSRSVTILD